MLKKERAKKTNSVSQMESDARPDQRSDVSYRSSQMSSDYTNGDVGHGNDKYKTFVKSEYRRNSENSMNSKPEVDEKTKKKICKFLRV